MPHTVFNARPSGAQLGLKNRVFSLALTFTLVVLLPLFFSALMSLCQSLKVPFFSLLSSTRNSKRERQRVVKFGGFNVIRWLVCRLQRHSLLSVL